MNINLSALLNGICLGVIATSLFDLWLLRQKLMGRRIMNFAFLGRWIGHFKNLKFIHTNIAQASAIPSEFMIGLIGHYAIGIFIAELLLLVSPEQWLADPDIFKALAIGALTVVFPLFIMQPGMGGGIAFYKTQMPLKNSFNSLFNHVLFGLCLYLAAHLMKFFNGCFPA